MLLYWMLTGVNGSPKKMPISEKSGNFGHLILSRKHRTEEEEATKWKT